MAQKQTKYLCEPEIGHKFKLESVAECILFEALEPKAGGEHRSSISMFQLYCLKQGLPSTLSYEGG